uniref:Odorant binding protein 1 n=1 Tax=Diaphorina citri TaxID=121845 RepID=A0A7T3UYT9_DIACI|nr:odorant binding protein 1 [Diaphorina citri]
MEFLVRGEIKSTSFKFLIFLVLFLSVNNILQTVSYSTKEFDNLAKVCNVSAEDLEICKKYEVPDSESGKCFLRCALQKLGMMNPAGDIDKEASIQTMIKSWPRFSSELNTELFTECYNQVQPVTKELAGTCELAYKLMKCLNVVTRKHGYYNDFLKSDK